jgi:hypothetical protein
MASIILTATGQEIGGNLGGNVGKAIGRTAGGFLGKIVDNKFFSKPNVQRGMRLEELSIQTSTYGKMIPILYGKFKISGNVIWAADIKERQQIMRKKLHRSSSFFDRANTQEIINYKYYANFSIGLVEGPIEEVERIWANNELLDIKNYTIRIYKGTEDQMPDSMIESILGKGNTPAYRGLSYIVFENFPLELFGNRLPNFSFEIKKDGANKQGKKSLEQLITSMVVIPGSGEFVYDTQIQYKFSVLVKDKRFLQVGMKAPINMNNKEGKADSLVALDQLQTSCPNLEWVAPVVSWFANDLDIKKASIVPGVEYKDLISRTEPDEWEVAGYTRENAYSISYSQKYGLSYGGSINDRSVLRYLEEIQSRNLKIMFYPMFFMDIDNKPWRGRMTGHIDDIFHFFNHPQGYNNFILHYAQLVKGMVDAFIIGSELIGITTITDGNGNFPGVTELIKLASRVKAILGPGVKVT